MRALPLVPIRTFGRLPRIRVASEDTVNKVFVPREQLESFVVRECSALADRGCRRRDGSSDLSLTRLWGGLGTRRGFWGGPGTDRLGLRLAARLGKALF